MRPRQINLSGSGSSSGVVTVVASTAGSGSPNAISSSASGTAYTNEGSTALNYNSLPTASAGLEYTFIVQDADGMRVTAATGDTIRISTNVSASAGYVESYGIGACVKLLAINSTEWIATSVVGVWSVN